MQPPSLNAETGFATAQKPPAQWVNYLFNAVGAWIDFLAGPNVEAWTRTAWGTSPATFDATSPVLLAVDTTTVDTVGAARRYLVAGWENSGGTATLRTSRRGNEWTRLDNINGSFSKPLALACFSKTSSSRWVISDDAGAIYYCAADAGGATGPVGSGSGDWSVTSVPGSMPNVIAFASQVDGSAVAALVSGSDGTVYSTASDNGSVWSNSPAVTGGSRTGDVLDVCWDGAKFIYVTDDGEIYASATAAGAFARQTVLATGAGAWRLAVGNVGTLGASETRMVVAYEVGGSSTSHVYLSTDSGATWSAITVVNGQTLWHLSKLRYQDGLWIAVETQAPWIVTSSDLSNWQAARAPMVGSDVALKDLAWDGGAWIIAGNGWVLQCPRGADPSGAVYVASSTPATLSDAGSLRGRLISTTAPTDGQVLTWDNALQKWKPATPSGGGTPSGSAGGDLSGTYPNPTVAKVNGVAHASTTPTDRQIYEYVAGSTEMRPFSPWVRKINGGPSTTDATPTVLVAWTAPVGDYDIEVRVRARKDTVAQSALWVLNFTVINIGGVVTVSGAAGGEVDIIGPIGSRAALEVGTSTLAVNISGTSVQIVGTGLAATNINWTAHLTAY